MIKTEQFTINNKQFVKTYSDSGFIAAHQSDLPPQSQEV